MKRLYVWCLVLLLPILAAASTIEVWWIASNEEIKVAEELIENDFTAKTGIKVNIKIAAWADHFEKALLAVAAGDPPDVLMTGAEQLFDFAIRGAIVTDLNKRFGKEFEDLVANLPQGTWKTHSYNGSWYGLPEGVGPQLGFYRTDILKDAGFSVPVTWDDLRALLPKLKARNLSVGFDGYLAPKWFGVATFAWQNGGTMITEDRKASALDSQQAIKGFKEFTDFFTKHGVPAEVSGYTSFISGEMPILLHANWIYASVRFGAPQLKDKFELGPLPGTMKDGKLNNTAWVHDASWGISKKSKNVNEAFKFLKWWLSEDVQVAYINRKMAAIANSVYLSANLKALAKAEIPTNDRKIIWQQVSVGTWPAFGIGSIIGTRHMTNAVMEVVLQKEDPEKAIRKAAKLMTDEMKRKQKEFERFVKNI
mgnify:CR=1 FL=1|jgi:ABC-type glycerol-3-phosphate transport system substrate-binding protein